MLTEAQRWESADVLTRWQMLSFSSEYISHTVFVYSQLVSGDFENAFFLDYCPARKKKIRSVAIPHLKLLHSGFLILGPS